MLGEIIRWMEGWVLYALLIYEGNFKNKFNSINNILIYVFVIANYLFNKFQNDTFNHYYDKNGINF